MAENKDGYLIVISRVQDGKSPEKAVPVFLDKKDFNKFIKNAKMQGALRIGSLVVSGINTLINADTQAEKTR